MEMTLIPKVFPNVGIIEGKLPESTIDNLWKLIKESRKQPEDMKSELAGNIDSSIRLNAASPLVEDFRQSVIPKFIDQNINSFGVPWRADLSEGSMWTLESLWVNFQKEHEFQPPHDHNGIYSFVIWMQIPTSYEQQRKLPISANSNADHHVSNFAFTYTDVLGKIKTFCYSMEKESEGYMIMFPATLTHQVFPFYNNDGERISISGNISTIRKETP